MTGKDALRVKNLVLSNIRGNKTLRLFRNELTENKIGVGIINHDNGEIIIVHNLNHDSFRALIGYARCIDF